MFFVGRSFSLVVAAALAVALFTSVGSHAACDDSKCYFVASSCRSTGALASIHSSADNALAQSAISEAGLAVAGIDGYYFESTGVEWEDFSSSDYTPSDFTHTSSGFLTVLSSGAWVIEPFKNRDSFSFLCWKVPETSTTTTTVATTTTTTTPTTTTTTEAPTTTTTATTTEVPTTTTTTVSTTTTTTEPTTTTTVVPETNATAEVTNATIPTTTTEVPMTNATTSIPAATNATANETTTTVPTTTTTTTVIPTGPAPTVAMGVPESIATALSFEVVSFVTIPAVTVLYDLTGVTRIQMVLQGAGCGDISNVSFEVAFTSTSSTEYTLLVPAVSTEVFKSVVYSTCVWSEGSSIPTLLEKGMSVTPFMSQMEKSANVTIQTQVLASGSVVVALPVVPSASAVGAQFTVALTTSHRMWVSKTNCLSVVEETSLPLLVGRLVFISVPASFQSGYLCAQQRAYTTSVALAFAVSVAPLVVTSNQQVAVIGGTVLLELPSSTTRSSTGALAALPALYFARTCTSSYSGSSLPVVVVRSTLNNTISPAVLFAVTVPTTASVGDSLCAMGVALLTSTGAILQVGYQTIEAFVLPRATTNLGLGPYLRPLSLDESADSFLKAKSALYDDGTSITLVPITQSQTKDANCKNTSNVVSTFTIRSEAIHFSDGLWGSVIATGAKYDVCYQEAGGGEWAWLRVVVSVLPDMKDTNWIQPGTILTNVGDTVAVGLTSTSTLVADPSTLSTPVLLSVMFAAEGETCATSGLTVSTFTYHRGYLVGKWSLNSRSYSICVAVTGSTFVSVVGTVSVVDLASAVSLQQDVMKAYRWETKDALAVCPVSQTGSAVMPSSWGAVLGSGPIIDSITDAHDYLVRELIITTHIVLGATEASTTVILPCSDCPFVAVLNGATCIKSTDLKKSNAADGDVAPVRVPLGGGVVLAPENFRAGTKFAVVELSSQASCEQANANTTKVMFTTTSIPILFSQDRTRLAVSPSLSTDLSNNATYALCVTLPSGTLADVGHLVVGTSDIPTPVEVSSVSGLPGTLIVTQPVVPFTVDGHFEGVEDLNASLRMVLVWGSGSACSNANVSSYVVEVSLAIDADMTTATGSLDSMSLDFSNYNDHASAIVCFRLAGSDELFPPTADTPPIALITPTLSTLDFFPSLPLRGPVNSKTRLLLSDEAMSNDLATTSVRQIMFLLTDPSASSSSSTTSISCDKANPQFVGITNVVLSDAAVSAVWLPDVTITSGTIRTCISVSSSSSSSFIQADARVIVSSSGLDDNSYVLRLWFSEKKLSSSSEVAATPNMNCADSNSFVAGLISSELLSQQSSSSSSTSAVVSVTQVSKIGSVVFIVAVGADGSATNSASNAAVAQLYATIRNDVSLLESLHTCNDYSFAPSVIGVAFPNGTIPSGFEYAAIVAPTTTPPTSQAPILMAPAGHASFAIFAVLALPLTLGVVLYAMCCGKVQEVLPGSIPGGDVEMGVINAVDVSSRPSALSSPRKVVEAAREEREQRSPSRGDGALSPMEGVSGAASPMPTHPLEKYMSKVEGGGGGMSAVVSPTSRTAENFHLDDRPVLSPRVQLKPEDYQDPLDS